jgi:ABC-type nitrate/sulfonate/bicarbonate transport system substrate-binding protein
MDMADEDVEFANVAVAVSRAYVKAQRDVTLRFLKAYVEGTRRFITDKEFGMNTLGKYTGSRDQEILSKTYDLFATKYIKRNPVLSLRGVEATLAMIADRSPKAKNRKAEEFMDTSLMAELDKSGFLKAVWK